VLDSDYIVLWAVPLLAWWIISAFAVKSAAETRGYGSGRWFWASLFLGPILAALLLIAHPVNDSTDKDGSGSGLSISPRT
jgi:hypothetical protein